MSFGFRRDPSFQSYDRHTDSVTQVRDGFIRGGCGIERIFVRCFDRIQASDERPIPSDFEQPTGARKMGTEKSLPMTFKDLNNLFPDSPAGDRVR